MARVMGVFCAFNCAGRQSANDAIHKESRRSTDILKQAFCTGCFKASVSVMLVLMPYVHIPWTKKHKY